MADKKKAPLTQADVEALQSLYDTLSAFHKEIKQKAQDANQNKALALRRYFEKFLVMTSADLSSIEARIRRTDMALLRKETKALADAQEDASNSYPDADWWGPCLVGMCSARAGPVPVARTRACRHWLVVTGGESTRCPDCGLFKLRSDLVHPLRFRLAVGGFAAIVTPKGATPV
jgi:hypothetical protein